MSCVQKLKRPPRFILDDLRDLWLAHEQVTGALMALNRSTWAGAIPVIVSLQQVDRVLCALYNRGESGYPPEMIARIRPPSGEPTADPTTEASVNG